MVWWRKSSTKTSQTQLSTVLLFLSLLQMQVGSTESQTKCASLGEPHWSERISAPIKKMSKAATNSCTLAVLSDSLSKSQMQFRTMSLSYLWARLALVRLLWYKSWLKHWAKPCMSSIWIKTQIVQTSLVASNLLTWSICSRQFTEGSENFSAAYWMHQLRTTRHS